MTACLRFTRRVWQSFVTNKGHDAQCFPNLQIHRAVPGEVEVSLKLEQYNSHYMTGVSTDIGTSFVRPAGRAGDTLHAKAVLTGLGKQLAYTRVDFTNPAGDLVAYGYHTKYVGKSSSHSENVTFSEDGETILNGEDKGVV
ncbi:thioesterase thiol ester dehydrase-isomerase [Pholiota molesta]|nr:thioesterase thiol ester dehydrase-isomerase [Pholiota molesta]